MKSEELDQMLSKANKRADDFRKAVTKYVKEQKGALNDRFGEKKKKPARKSASKKKAATKKTPKKK